MEADAGSLLTPAYLSAASSCPLLWQGGRLDFSSSWPNSPLLRRARCCRSLVWTARTVQGAAWCNPCSVCATPPAVHLQTGTLEICIWKEVCLILPLCLFTHRSHEYRTFCRCMCEIDSLASTFVPNLWCGPKGLPFSLQNVFFRTGWILC